MKNANKILFSAVMLIAFISAITFPAHTQTTKTAVQRITVVDSFSFTIPNNAYGVLIEGSATTSSKFYFSFDPKPEFVSATHIYINGIWTWAGSGSHSDTIDYHFSHTPTISGTVELLGWLPKAFNHNGVVSTINVGMNELTITARNDWLYLHRLELFIEYQYQETTTPPMAEVSYPELLMVLGFGLVIAYNVYNKLKPRLIRAAKVPPEFPT